MNTANRLAVGPAGEATAGPAVSHRVGRSALALALVTAALLLAAGSAGAQEQRLHQVNWTHATPGEVQGFVILISPVEGSVSEARQVNVGIPAPTPIGSTNLYSAMVSFAANEFLAVAAIGHNGLMSVPSDWSGMPPTRPGQPLPVGN